MATKPKNDFRKTLRKAMFLEAREAELFEKIPDAILDGIFKHNFNGNLAMAERVLFNRHAEVDRVDRGRLEQEKTYIHGLAKAAGQVSKALAEGEQILFVTDNDNDGSLAQAVLLEFSKALPQNLRRQIHVEYAQPIGNTRGLTKEVVDKAFEDRRWSKQEKVLIITADNGINNQIEAERISGGYKNTRLIITDHHLPMQDLVVQEGPRAMIVNPKYKPTEYFKKKNISGANTLGVLLRQSLFEIIRSNSPNAQPDAAQRQALANMDEIGSWGNLLDYANADMADMPIRPYIVEKALKLRPLLNVSNSMSNLVTGEFTDKQLEAVADASQGAGTGKELTVDWIRERIGEVKTLNAMARKLLNISHRHWGVQDTYNERDFYSMLAEELSTKEDTFESINPNYVEQLRPIIFNLAAIDNKDIFWALTYDTMVEVFQKLRQNERLILDGLREVSLLRELRRPNSTILYPVDPAVTKVFNRKLLGKAYNQDNNGFLLILSSVDKREATGSMRSLYPISKLLEDKVEIEEKLGITVEFQGHEQAAGFFIRSADNTDLTEQKIFEFNSWMDDRVGELKMAERINQIPTVEVDFASASLAKKINAAVKANLAGMWGLPTVIRFSPNRADGVWVTDPETTEQVNLGELVKKKHYGYQAIATDFDGGAIVVPIELLRSIVDSDYKKALRLSYLDDGVFMGSQVVDAESLPNLTPLKGGRKDQEELADYYEKTYKDSNFIPLSRDDFRSSPYFRYNKHGQSEFEMWESLIIHLLDEAGADILAVVDTEGTGLGKAPKCFNIGGTNVKIAENSGKRLQMVDFEARYFRNQSGREFLLTEDQMKKLVPLDDGQDAPEGAVVLHKTSVNQGVSYRDRAYYEGKQTDLERVTNVKENGSEVVYNRQIDGFAFSFLINNHDFAITKEFEDLTGIGNWMVERLGRPADSVDKKIVQYYEGLKGADGAPAKIIFQAHNMPYDRGVISANLQKLDRLMVENLTSDTAKIARQAKLAYDDTPVSSFEGVTGLPAKSYFYDSPYSDYSLSTFLARAARGKSGVFADTTAKLLLRYNAEQERFSVIDRVANREITLDDGMDDMLNKKRGGTMPNNAVKYSVERMSSRAMIRNILLMDKGQVKKIALTPDEEPHRAALELFQENYHFDITPERNIEHFKASLFANESEVSISADVDLEDFAQRFLSENKSIQARFHDGWIYEKVLNIHEPDTANLRVSSEIVEQVNYYTDLPSSKIRKVFDDYIRFARHWKIQHGMVHEQHNNVRQRSDDGQGLSDTAYEVVLPQMLGMMKFYNPYYQSVKPAVEEMIKANIQGSMVQTLMAREYNSEIALDSYSMTQMNSFRRHGKTDLVQRAQNLTKKGEMVDGQLAPVKFKLSGEILPPNSAVYATPRSHQNMEQIRKDAKTLEFILVNEQMKTAARAKGINQEYRERILEIAAANDAKAIACRDELMQRYSYIEFNRKDGHTKKMLDIVRDAFEGAEPKFPRNFPLTKTLAEAGLDMIEDMKDICAKTGLPSAFSSVDQLREILKAVAEQDPEMAAIEQASSGKEEVVFDSTTVRQHYFLPDLSVERREPLKFAFDHYGIDFCFAHLNAPAEEDVEQEPAPVASRKRARKP